MNFHYGPNLRLSQQMHASSLPQPVSLPNPYSAQPWFQGPPSLAVPAPYNAPQWQTSYQPQWANPLLSQPSQAIPSSLKFQRQLQYGLSSESTADHPWSNTTSPSLPVPPSSASSSPPVPSSASTSEPANPSELEEAHKISLRALTAKNIYATHSSTFDIQQTSLWRSIAARNDLFRRPTPSHQAKMALPAQNPQAINEGNPLARPEKRKRDLDLSGKNSRNKRQKANNLPSVSSSTATATTSVASFILDPTPTSPPMTRRTGPTFPPQHFTNLVEAQPENYPITTAIPLARMPSPHLICCSLHL